MYYDTLGILSAFLCGPSSVSPRPALNESPKRIFKIRMFGCTTRARTGRRALMLSKKKLCLYIPGNWCTGVVWSDAMSDE